MLIDFCLFPHVFLVALTLVMHSTYCEYYEVPLAPIGHDGRVVDTPEVARAKAAHLAAVSEAAARIPHNAASYATNQDYRGYAKPISVGHQTYHSGYAEYHGPLAPLDRDGRVVDTPEVARAKAMHLEAYNRLASSTPVVFDHSQIYKPAVYNHDGYYGKSSDSSSYNDDRD